MTMTIDTPSNSVELRFNAGDGPAESLTLVEIVTLIKALTRRFKRRSKSAAGLAAETKSGADVLEAAVNGVARFARNGYDLWDLNPEVWTGKAALSSDDMAGWTIDWGCANAAYETALVPVLVLAYALRDRLDPTTIEFFEYADLNEAAELRLVDRFGDHGVDAEALMAWRREIREKMKQFCAFSVA